MKKILILIIVALVVAIVHHLTISSKTISQNKVEAIEKLLKTVVADTLEKDYHSHNMTITAVVTDLKTDRITQEKTPDHTLYSVQGRITYIIQGKREWRVKEGNVVQLAPEADITHWFSCELFEDRYGGLYTDKYRNRLEFYADKPAE